MRMDLKLVEESYKCHHGEQVRSGCRSISLVAARRDWAAFQILLQGDEEFVLSTGPNAAFAPSEFNMIALKEKHLETIRLDAVLPSLPSARIQMCPVGFADDDDGVPKSDSLLNCESVIVKYKRVQPVWVEILLPEDAKPSTYRGEIAVYRHTLFDDETRVDTLSFDIAVKDVVMPRPQEFVFHLDLWQHLSNISRKHEVTLWSDEHFRVIEEYVKSLAQLGLKAVTVIASEIPWSGQRCYRIKDYPSDLFEYNMARVRRNAQGVFTYDFSVMDRYIQLCAKHGINGEIEVFGLLNIWVDAHAGFGKAAPDHPDAIRIRYLDEADGLYKYMHTAGEIGRYVQALEGHFKKKGFTDRTLLTADEPEDLESYRKRLKWLKGTAPSFRYKTVIDHAEIIRELKGQITDFAPILHCVCEEWDLLQEMRKETPGRVLWYVSCTTSRPNTFICSPLLESRLMGILTAYMDYDGFLRWNYTAWPETPRERIAYKFPQWKAGDTNFVYPANDGRPLLTLRYKNLKRGIEDFELLRLLKENHPKADSILETIWNRILKTRNLREFHPSSGKEANDLYSLNAADYQWMKALVLDALAKESSERHCRHDRSAVPPRPDVQGLARAPG